MNNQKWVKLLTGFSEYFVDEICCAKVPHPNLKYGFGSAAFVSTFTTWSCKNGKCEDCGINKKNISNCSMLMLSNTTINLLKCKNAPRPTVKSNKKYPFELTNTKDAVANVISKLLKQS